MWERLKNWGMWSPETKVTEITYDRSCDWQNIPREEEAGKYFFGNFLPLTPA